MSVTAPACQGGRTSAFRRIRHGIASPYARWTRREGIWRRRIRFVDGEQLSFGDDAVIKMTPLGVEILERTGDDAVKVLFPWARIERVTQRGPQVAAIYTY